MSYLSYDPFTSPLTLHHVASGLASSYLNPPEFNGCAAPLRFVIGLIVAAVSPVFAACDFVVSITVAIVFSVRGAPWQTVTRKLEKVGIVLLRFIPDAIIFPFAFAINPRLYGAYAPSWQ